MRLRLACLACTLACPIAPCQVQEVLTGTMFSGCGDGIRHAMVGCQLWPSMLHSPAWATLRVKGRAQVELVGRVQRQEQDALWYTCINHVRVLGKPLYNFVPALPAPGSPDPGQAAQPGSLLLRMVRQDPMVAAGGLMQLSEGGTLEKRLQLEAQYEAQGAQPGALAPCVLHASAVPRPQCASPPAKGAVCCALPASASVGKGTPQDCW